MMPSRWRVAWLLITGELRVVSVHADYSRASDQLTMTLVGDLGTGL